LIRSGIFVLFVCLYFCSKKTLTLKLSFHCLIVLQNAIIGYHPNISNLMLCNGFSGHGLQQSPAAGRAVAELLTNGKFSSIDLSRFSFDRILNNAPIFEEGIV
jgi:hypothetical protein